MSVEPLAYTAQLQEYAIAHSDHDPVIEELAAESDALDGGSLASMRMAPEQAAFTTVLVRAIGARRALEIGTFTGYGSIAIARGLAPGGGLLTCDISDAHSGIARKYWRRLGLEDRVEQRIAPAIETLRSLDGSDPFDFAFIDADKEGYPDYYEQCLRLVRPGGLIAIDNVFRRGDVVDAGGGDPDLQAIRELNDRIARDERLAARAMVSIADGLLLAVPGPADAPPREEFSQAEVEAAVARLSETESFAEAERIVARAAPGLQRVLATALGSGGWFGESHESELLKAATTPDPDRRLTAVRTLMAEETRLGMMVGVAVGWALRNDLQRGGAAAPGEHGVRPGEHE